MKKRKDNRYSKQIYLGKKDSGKVDDTGKPIMISHYKYVYGHSIAEVTAKAEEIKRQLGKNMNLWGAQEPFINWSQRLLEYKQLDGVSISYLEGLKRCEKHLIAICDIAIGKIGVQQIQYIINSLATEQRKADGTIVKKALSKSTLGMIAGYAKKVFRHAIRMQALEFNPADMVYIPKGARKTKRESIKEYQQKWIYQLEHRAKRAAMLMLFGGLRRGEVSALTWDDIDLDESYISITKASVFIKGQPFIKEPKTKAGLRTVDIPDILVKYLRLEKEKDDCVYVFHSNKGAMLSLTSWKNIWKSYMMDLNVKYGYCPENLKKWGLDTNKDYKKNVPGGLEMRIEKFTPHQLRHTFASNCYFAGVPAEVCRDWMGHADCRTTLDIYTHLDARFKRAKTDEVNAYYTKQVNEWSIDKNCDEWQYPSNHLSGREK